MPGTRVEKRAGRQPPEVAEESRRRIIASARVLFAARGYEAVGLRDIAAGAGTTHGLVRHHFGSKMGVFQAVADAADAEFAAALAPLREELEGGDAVEAAARFIRRFVAVAAQQPDLTGLLMLEGASEGPRLAYILEQLAGPRALLAPLLSRLQALGHLRQFSERTLLHFLLFAGAAPFALPALTGGVLGSRLSAGEHAERLVVTLLGDAAPRQRPR